MRLSELQCNTVCEWESRLLECDSEIRVESEEKKRKMEDGWRGKKDKVKEFSAL